MTRRRPSKGHPHRNGVSLHAAMVEHHGIAHSRDEAQENGSDRLNRRYASPRLTRDRTRRVCAFSSESGRQVRPAQGVPYKRRLEDQALIQRG